MNSSLHKYSKIHGDDFTIYYRKREIVISVLLILFLVVVAFLIALLIYDQCTTLSFSDNVVIDICLWVFIIACLVSFYSIICEELIKILYLPFLSKLVYLIIHKKDIRHSPIKMIDYDIAYIVDSNIPRKKYTILTRCMTADLRTHKTQHKYDIIFKLGKPFIEVRLV